MATPSARPDVLDITDLGKVLTVLKDNHFPDDQWDDLGLKLGIIQTELKTIKKDNQDSNDRLKECLSRWLQQSYDTTQYGLPSMESLVTALRGMDLNATASKLVPGVIMSAQHEQSTIRNRFIVRPHDSIASELDDLHSSFSCIVGKVRDRLGNLIDEEKLCFREITFSIEEYLYLKGHLLQLQSIQKLFDSLRDYYYYLNPSVIKFIIKKFLTKEKKSSCMEYITRWLVQKDEDLLGVLERYLDQLHSFEESTQLKSFKSDIDNAFLTHHSPSSGNTCEVSIKLNNRWDELTMKSLKLLLKRYFRREDLFNHIKIEEGSICITYLVPSAATPDLIAAAAPKAGSMHRVGVFYLSINGKVLLEEKDNVNIDESLVEAVKLNDTFEVSVLLSLGADPYYQDDNGDSPMMLASLGESNEVKKLLLPADEWDDATELMESEETCGVKKVEEDNDPHSSARVNQLLAVIKELSATKTELALSLASSKSEIEILQEKISSQSVQLINTEKMQRAEFLENERLLQDMAVMKDKLAKLEEQLQNRQLLNQMLKQYSEESCQTDLKMEDQFTHSELIPKKDQSTQSMEVLLPEIDREQIKVEGMLTIDDLIEIIDLLKRCAFPETKWDDLGLRLGLLKNTLDVINMNCLDVSHCLIECLSQWLHRADNVDSRGGATWDSMSVALRSMNEVAVADKLNQEKLLPSLALSLYNSYHPHLSQSLSDPISVARLLYGEHVIAGSVLSDVESASSSLPKQREVLLSAVREAVQSRHSALKTFASVLCKFTDNVQIGGAILRDYRKFVSREEFDEDKIQLLEDVEISISKSKSREFRSIRASFARMVYNVSKVVTQSHHLELDELKEFLYAYNSDLRAKLDNCDSIQSVVGLITDEECSLTDITLLEAVVEHFKVTEAEKYVEEYKTLLEQFYKSLSVSLCLKEKFEAVEASSLKSETATYVLDWRPEEKMLRDITDILSKTSGKLVRIKFIDTGY